jgi:antitoxin MazE
MKAVIARWGNSLGVRLPKEAARTLGVDAGATVEIVARGETVTLKRVEPTLDELLAGITPDNLHGETDTDIPQGRETW